MGPAVVAGDYIGGAEPEAVGLVEVGEPVDAGDPGDAATVVLAPVVALPVTPSAGGAELDPDRIEDRRRVLWRDSATILIGVILALLAFQTFAPGGVGEPTGSATPFPSGVSIGTLPPPASLPPGVTFGPIIDPSLGVDATPTPIPVITLGPSPSPSPSPEPFASAKPSAVPTKRPTPRPPSAPPPSVPASIPASVPPTIEPPLPSAPASEAPSPSL